MHWAAVAGADCLGAIVINYMRRAGCMRAAPGAAYVRLRFITVLYSNLWWCVINVLAMAAVLPDSWMDAVLRQQMICRF